MIGLGCFDYLQPRAGSALSVTDPRSTTVEKAVTPKIEIQSGIREGREDFWRQRAWKKQRYLLCPELRATGRI